MVDTAGKWPTQEVRELEELTHEIMVRIRKNPKTPGAYVFRGQVDKCWGLLPSLLRLYPRLHGWVDSAAITRDERELLRQFKSQAHIHLDPRLLPSEDVDIVFWWTLMQHYSAPTRLLDWTLSPYVAAYFASNEKWDTPGAVWCIDAAEVTRRLQDKGDESYKNVNDHLHTLPGSKMQPEVLEDYFLDRDAEDNVFCFESPKKTDRMVAQHSILTVSSQVGTNHRDILHGVLNGDSEGIFHMKLVIPADAKPRFLSELRWMNLTPSSLFPGIDGLGKSIGQLVRLMIKNRG